MSGDSDDEDELLQMALKEQAQRDLNHQRPPSSASASNQRKPAENFVRALKAAARQGPSMANHHHQQQQQQQQMNGRVVEEDDDSEVEMLLSISSGDEEVSIKNRGGAKGRSGAAGREGGRGAREDNRSWDGEEPHCWKRVEETELENTVRLLLELEPESDPVWHYLNVQYNRIRGLLEKRTLDHETRMQSLINEMCERALYDARWRQIQQNLNQSSDTEHSLGMENVHPSVDSLMVDMAGEEVDALRGKYIRRLTGVLIYHIPAFWKIALSVFSGKFVEALFLVMEQTHCLDGKKQVFLSLIRKHLLLQSSQVSAESNVNTSENKSEEKVGDWRYSAHSLGEVAGMICNTLSAYDVKVHNTYLDLEESNILCSYMSTAIKEISNACLVFEVKESAPPITVMALRTLQAELSKICILRICSWMRATTEEISKQETWIPMSMLERNKSPYTSSFLPLAFRSLIGSAMDQINLSEARKSEDMFVQLQEIQESVRLAFLNCFLDFAGHLEHVGREFPQNKSSKESPHLQNGLSYETEENLSFNLPGSVVDLHQQLLIVLSNIGYCKDELSSSLYGKYRNTWSQSREKYVKESDIHDLVMSFSGLEEKVLAQYAFAKGVRVVAVELLHTLVAVHSEVFTGAKPMLDKTLGILVEGLIDTFLSIFHENKSKDLRPLGANGFCQLMLELEYFEAILNPYFTPDARDSPKSLQGLLLEKATKNVAESVEIPGHQRRSTRGSEDSIADDRQQGLTVSPDDLIALAQQCSSELLQTELERTRINIACFFESMPLDSVPEPAKAAYAFKGSMDSPSRNYRATQATASPRFSRPRHR